MIREISLLLTAKTTLSFNNFGTKGYDEYSKKSDSSADDLSEAEELTDIEEDALRVQLKAADDVCLNNAANIGTALMVTNSHRVMALL